jgi:hypothetical protein
VLGTTWNVPPDSSISNVLEGFLNFECSGRFFEFRMFWKVLLKYTSSTTIWKRGSGQVRAGFDLYAKYYIILTIPTHLQRMFGRVEEKNWGKSSFLYIFFLLFIAKFCIQNKPALTSSHSSNHVL